MLVAVICSAAGTLVCGGSRVYVPALALLDYTLLCWRPFVRRACMGIPLGRLAPAGSSRFRLLCALCVFPCCALCFRALVPFLLSHTLHVSWHLRSMPAGDVRACSLVGDGAVVVLFPSCVARHGSLSTLASVA